MRLVAWSEDGCSDTATNYFPFIQETTIYFPNSFTPDGDGLNDEFGIEGESIRFEDFELIIYDRWGHQVFGSTRPDRKWDGVNMDGDILPAGVYSLSLHYRTNVGELKFINDHIVISASGLKKGL
jgi:gliding motility-associated-like protein